MTRIDASVVDVSTSKLWANISLIVDILRPTQHWLTKVNTIEFGSPKIGSYSMLNPAKRSTLVLNKRHTYLLIVTIVLCSSSLL